MTNKGLEIISSEKFKFAFDVAFPHMDDQLHICVYVCVFEWVYNSSLVIDDAFDLL